MADRMPPISKDEMTTAQAEAAAAFETSRGYPIFGPFIPLLRSPQLLNASNSLGLFCRYQSSLPPDISELLILITSREHTSQVEWAIHFPIAVEKGIAEGAALDICNGRPPQGLTEKQYVAWRFASVLLKTKGVPDEEYAEAINVYGEEGVMDIIGVCGYYTFLAYTLNTARTPRPDSRAPMLPPL